jgi:hypothetical protein
MEKYATTIAVWRRLLTPPTTTPTTDYIEPGLSQAFISFSLSLSFGVDVK